MKVAVRLVSVQGARPPGIAADGTGSLDLAAGASLADALAALDLPAEGTYAALVNGDTVAPEDRADHDLAEGDEVTVFPPISGG